MPRADRAPRRPGPTAGEVSLGEKDVRIELDSYELRIFTQALLRDVRALVRSLLSIRLSLMA